MLYLEILSVAKWFNKLDVLVMENFSTLDVLLILSISLCGMALKSLVCALIGLEMLLSMLRILM